MRPGASRCACARCGGWELAVVAASARERDVEADALPSGDDESSVEPAYAVVEAFGTAADARCCRAKPRIHRRPGVLHTLRRAFDHPRELGARVAALTCELHQLGDPAEQRAALRRAGDSDPVALT
jgi:hypothetical protein